jgi:S-adenosylmethionine decarboxylase
MMTKNLKHVIMDIEKFESSVMPDLLNDGEKLRQICFNAVDESGMEIVDYKVCQFPKQDVTVILVLAESHLSLHTWPEDNEYYLDIFTCGEKADPFRCIFSIYNTIGGKIKKIKVVRGS